MSWAKPEPITGGVVYEHLTEVEKVVPLDDIDDDGRECLRAYIQGDLDHLAECIVCQEDGLAQEEGVLNSYPEPPDYRLLTPAWPALPPGILTAGRDTHRGRSKYCAIVTERRLWVKPQTAPLPQTRRRSRRGRVPSPFPEGSTSSSVQRRPRRELHRPPRPRLVRRPASD